MDNSGYILGISRGHNAGACLLKDGKIVFSLEEERLSRQKYDGGPYATMMKVKEYTDKLDYIFISHTQPLEQTAGKVDYSGEDVYTGLARKMGLIDRKTNLINHPQVIDLSHSHHKIHAACAFYRSGFTDAVAVVIDGAGTMYPAQFGHDQIALWETETIFNCSYPANFKTLYKHLGCRDPIVNFYDENCSSEKYNEQGTHAEFITGNAGITKVYEAVTEYCGFSAIEAGKTMGLFPYGKLNNNIPELFTRSQVAPISDRNVVVPRYPNGAMINSAVYTELQNSNSDDLTLLQNRRDLAYACQKQTQDMALDVILKAVKMSGKQQVVFSGGYALNCVANYYFLDRLNKENIELYVEPISNDGGTAIGVALWGYYELTQSNERMNTSDIYLGPEYIYSEDDIVTLAEKYGGTIQRVNDDDVIELIRNKNIVALFQGRSENGPRALGNRSLLFDPTFKDGKDFVNLIKKREYFRPFAGSILAEDVHEWFDLRGMQDSPHMMYAVNCKEGIEEKIPSIIHVDGTCRIQTVTERDNPLYYWLIRKFKEKTGIPIVFNTSFNLGGEPLVETLEDALWTLQQSDIQYLYLPEYNTLITVMNAQII